MRRSFLICAAMAALSAAAFAADVTGNWTGQMGPDGGMTITFHFKQDGAKLTGTVDGPGGDPMPIADGKVDGNKIAFTVSFNDMKILHEGTVQGDEITLNIKMEGGPGGGDGGPGPMKLKRAK